MSEAVLGSLGRRAASACLIALFAVLAATPAVVGEAGAVVQEGELGLVLNLPAYRLDVYREGERIRSYTVAIGKRTHPTPVGTFRVSHVDWNPWWHPPDSPWAAGREVTPPGPTNPMGRVKIYFRDLYYLHGTPEVGSLGSAASHGCVRMRNEDVIELARLLHRYASPGVPAELLDRLEHDTGATRTLTLERSVLIELRYRVAELRDGRLKLYPDVYGRAGPAVAREQALQALSAAGHDVRSVDDAGLRELVRESRQAPVSVPLSAIVADGAVAR